MKHFENLWEEAETVSSQKDISVSELVSKLEPLVRDLCDSSSVHQKMGDVIFILCAISARTNVNTYAALQRAIDDAKTDILEPEL